MRRQPAAFVRPCWYRAFVDNRPEGIVVDSPEHFEVLCEGLEGLQREGCITAVSVIGPPDPAEQLELCAALADAADAASCIRGTKTQNLLGASTTAFVRLVERCEQFAGVLRTACYRWLGKTVAVLTNGASSARMPSAGDEEARVVCRRSAQHGGRARHLQLS